MTDKALSDQNQGITEEGENYAQVEYTIPDEDNSEHFRAATRQIIQEPLPRDNRDYTVSYTVTLLDKSTKKDVKIKIKYALPGNIIGPIKDFTLTDQCQTIYENKNFKGGNKLSLTVNNAEGNTYSFRVCIKVRDERGVEVIRCSPALPPNKRPEC